MKKNLIADLITMLFMALFFYTATQKLLVTNTAKYILRKYPVLNIAPTFSAWAVPIFELCLVGLLLFRRSTGLKASLLTMTGFSLYVSYMLLFLPSMPCTCGGFIQQLNWPMHLALNLILTTLAYVGVRMDKLNSRTQSTENIFAATEPA